MMEHHGAIVRTLYIPELTAIVFCFLGERDLARCARVCKSWSEPALDALWRTMSSVQPLMALLSPLDRMFDVRAPQAIARRATFMNSCF